MWIKLEVQVCDRIVDECLEESASAAEIPDTLSGQRLDYFLHHFQRQVTQVCPAPSRLAYVSQLLKAIDF